MSMSTIGSIMPNEVADLIRKEGKISIIDVREPHELMSGKIPNAVNIPLGELEFRVEEIDPAAEHIIVCYSGGRSGVACQFLAAQGIKVKNMLGGMSHWEGV